MSKRLEILNAIKAKLLLIKRQDGYNSDVVEASIAYIPQSKVVSYSTICLLPLESNYKPLTQSEYTTGTNAMSIDGWPIVIIGYCRTDIGDEKLTAAMENLVQDIIKAILSDYTLGLNYVNNCYLVAIDTVQDLKSEVGVVYVSVAVKYDFEKSEP